MPENTDPINDPPQDRDPLLRMFLARHEEKAVIPDHAPLLCLAFYLYLDFEDQKDRVEQTNKLFYRSHDPECMEELKHALEQDKPAFECYLEAKKALAQEEIEAYISEPDPSPLLAEHDRENENAYTISFLIWAEKQGHKIPDHVMGDIKTLLEIYYVCKNSRDEKKEIFPRLPPTILQD